jgi:hypothetical protein
MKKHQFIVAHTKGWILSHTIPPSMVFVIGERIYFSLKKKFSLNISKPKSFKIL